MGKVVSKVTGALGLTADPTTGQGAMGMSAALQARAVRELEKVGIPPIEAQKIVLEQPELVLSSLEERLGPSAMEEIKTDARLQETQMKALAELERAGEEGFTAEDKAKFEALQRQIGSDEKARQATILQQMAQRGALDSGAQLAAQLGSSQAATQRASEQATQMAAQQAAARRGALSQAAQAAGNIQQTQFGQQAQKASAQDRISAFNASVAARDTAARQQHAQQAAQLANQQQMHNKALLQQNFQNQMAKATGVSSALGNQAQGMMNQAQMQAHAAQQEAAGVRGVLQAGAGAALGFAGLPSDRNMKEDISPSSDAKIEEMLDELSAYDYKYKDQDRYKEGPQTGIMAQDLEKSELGSEFVEDTPEGKMVDYGKMSGTLAAALANVNERLKRVEGKDFNNGGVRYSASNGLNLGNPLTPEQFRQQQVNQITGSGGFNPADMKNFEFEKTLQDFQNKPMFDDQIAPAIKEVATRDTSVASQAMLATPDSQGVAASTDAPSAGEQLKGAKDKKALHKFGMDLLNSADTGLIERPKLAAINPNDIGAAIARSQQGFADGGMNYESGGEGTIITSGTDSYAGDELPDRINDGEMVLNLDQQDRMNSLLQELAERRRGDEMVNNGEAMVNEGQQDTLMAIARGEAEPEDLDPEAPIVERSDSTASDLEALLAQLGGMEESPEMPSDLSQYMDPSFEPLPQEEVEEFMNGGIGRKFYNGDVQRLYDIPGVPEELDSASLITPYASMADQTEGQQDVDRALLERAADLSRLEVDTLNKEEAERANALADREKVSEAVEDAPEMNEPITITPKEEEDSEEEEVDKDLRRAKTSDVIMDLIQNLNNALGHFDAANPYANLKPIKGDYKQSDFEAQLQKARKMAEAKTDKKEAKEYRDKMFGLKEREVAVKEKAAGQKAEKMSDEQKIKLQSKLKEDVAVKKEKREEQKELKSSLKDVQEKKDKIKQTMEALDELTKSSWSDTGPMDQFTSKMTDKGQKLEQLFNDLALDKMTKMFKGMSKAIDSDSERKFFMNAQAGMNKYPSVNKQILQDMLKNAESLESKLQTQLGGEAPSQEKSTGYSDAQERGIQKVMSTNNISREEAIQALQNAGKL